MSVPFYNSVTDKVAREKLGVSASDFEVIVEDGHLLVDSLNTNKLFVDSASLESYIKKYGGKEERFRDKVSKKLHEAKIKEISRIKREVRSIGKNNYKNNEKIERSFLYDKTVKNSFDTVLTDIIEGTSRDIEVITHKTLNDILGSSIIELHEMSEYKKIPYTKTEIADIDKHMETIKLFRINEKTLKELHSLGFEDSELNEYYDNTDLDFNDLFVNASIKLDYTTKSLYSHFFETYRSTIDAYESIDYELSESARQEVITDCEKKYNSIFAKCIF